MYADQQQMLAKKKLTAGIVCIAAGALMALTFFLPWLKVTAKRGGGEVTMTLLSIEACGGKRCESMSNFKLADDLADGYAKAKEYYDQAIREGEGAFAGREPKKPGTLFPIFGLLTLIVGVVAVGALIASGALALKGRFITRPVALTSVAMIATGLTLVIGCVFLATKPDGEGFRLGVSWPFFLFGATVVGAIVGVQMAAKAFAPPEYDPYADPMAPPPAAG
ncbi:MAG: hypothetical protein KBG48_28330 [Kofleriaceae bacterium]|nr:hypothetical protein [Kofleriaceae bacterium]MBP9171338.1 hypothetical protein [Kofleriaceae bacterium]MBP9860815.1 hypothetical protein [Kofleriaceae bacterium]